jgi:hypothetical protein
MKSEFDVPYRGFPASYERISRSSITLAWIVGTSVIVGFLTAMLIMGIAITV